MAPNRRVLIVLPERVHLMDVVGPAQVFTSAAEAGAGYALSYVAERSGTETHQGLGLTAPTSWPALGEGDLVIVPGWRAQAGGGAVLDVLSSGVLDRLCRHWERGGHLASVCAEPSRSPRPASWRGARPLPVTT